MCAAGMVITLWSANGAKKIKQFHGHENRYTHSCTHTHTKVKLSAITVFQVLEDAKRHACTNIYTCAVV